MYGLIDTPVCIVYAMQYFLQLYIAVNRCQFFIDGYNIIQLFLVIIPPIFVPWSSRSQISLSWLAFSRLYRLERAT